MKTLVIIVIVNYLLFETIISAFKKSSLYSEPSFIVQTTAFDKMKPEDYIQKNDLAVIKPKNLVVPVNNTFTPSTTISNYKTSSRSTKEFKLSRFKHKPVYNRSIIKTKTLTKLKIKAPAMVKALIDSALKDKMAAEALAKNDFIINENNDHLNSAKTVIEPDSVAGLLNTINTDEKHQDAIATAEHNVKPFVPSNLVHDLKITDGTIVVPYTVVAKREEISDDVKAGNSRKYAVTSQKEAGTEDYKYMELFEKAEKLKKYAAENGYSTKYGFFINMGMKSGKKRFFVVDLSVMTIVKHGMVAHGRGKERFTLEKTYSNEPGSNCTSLGIYKIGKSYTGMFGKAFKLYGLQQSNNNAYKRSIVLHAMNTIPDAEIDYPIFQSEGCPSVSPTFLNEIGSIIKEDSKSVLMWIFDPVKESQFLHCSY